MPTGFVFQGLTASPAALGAPGAAVGTHATKEGTVPEPRDQPDPRPDPTDAPSLPTLVDTRSVRLHATASDWREAIREAGDALVAAGACASSYTEAMIRSVEEHGPYIVLSPGLALPHARPDNSVTRTALSYVRLTSPVAFGHETNDPVRVVMALAAADGTAHLRALADLATVLADPQRRHRLDNASTPAEVLDALRPPQARPPAGRSTEAAGGTDSPEGADGEGDPGTAEGTADASSSTGSTETTVASTGLVLTVCGNGLGTSLFLKNTLEQVLDTWGWLPYLRVEATDTISARGRAKDADLLLTSGAIAQALGDPGTPVEVIEDFTSLTEVDAALRRTYAV
ncbi:PTS sugar transporter subunit IIA [Actinomyces lilanjuaniae]|uniref:PTS sugar transporter subunit IIA n=1 Tax=Actinomyces lilanjuaniae TaxID=2321394 RepID=UPI0019698C9D|nr:PTS sugar transporter subunit IIA [Actinomyces lilanjuaniae]